MIINALSTLHKHMKQATNVARRGPRDVALKSAFGLVRWFRVRGQEMVWQQLQEEQREIFSALAGFVFMQKGLNENT